MTRAEFFKNLSLAFGVKAAEPLPLPESKTYVITTPGCLSQEAVKNIKEAWLAAYSPEPAPRLHILQGGLRIHPLDMDPQELAKQITDQVAAEMDRRVEAFDAMLSKHELL